MSEIEKTGPAESGFKLSGPVSFVFANPSGVLLTLKVDGSYELGGTVEELLAHDQPICRAFGAALRDQYEAGRQGVPAPKSGKDDAVKAIEEAHRAILAGPPPEPRWKAVPHCSDTCFEASVIDTTKPMANHLGFDPICEAWSIEDAEKIAAALNAAEPV